MQRFLDICLPLMRETGDMLMSMQHENRLVSEKSSAIDLLTEADEKAQDLLISAIHQAFPTHAFVAEEGNLTTEPSDYTWVIDPIDGTTNFWHCFPLFSISVALCHAGDTIIGAIYLPWLKELFVATRGGGAYLNDTRLHVSSTRHLEQAVVATGFPYQRAPGCDNNLTEFGRVMPFVQGIRRTGSAAIDLAYVAAGRFDGYWEFHVRPWDTMAGMLLVQEAGGRVSRVRDSGEMNGAGGVLATNGHIHPALHRLLKGGEEGGYC